MEELYGQMVKSSSSPSSKGEWRIANLCEESRRTIRRMV